MIIKRTLPPSAALLTWRDLLHGFSGILWEKRSLNRLESEIRDYFGVQHLFLVSSGKGALFLILKALTSLSPRKKVVIPAYTCFSVPSAIIKAGLEVVLCDIHPETLDFDFDLLKGKIDDETLCVVPGHLFGIPSDINRVKALCGANGVFLIEDAAQAMGGEYQGKKLGTLGDVGFFSLGRGKNITAGSGGMIVTNSKQIARALQTEYSGLRKETFLKKLKNLLEVIALYFLINPRMYGFPAALPFLGLGETHFLKDFPVSRFDGFRAGILFHWKNRLEESNRIREAAAGDLMSQFARAHTRIPSSPREKTIYLRLPLIMESKEAKDQLCRLSRKKGLGISRMYPTGVHEIKELQSHLESTHFPVASQVAEQLVTLPVHAWVRPEDQEHILKTINEPGENFRSFTPEMRDPLENKPSNLRHSRGVGNPGK
ncbi:MAG: DegT/DnrJ/EryC1/StrS family aminotransferase [Nitrospiria bacterium]